MENKKICLYEEGEYSYSRSEGFVPFIVPYIQEGKEILPCIIVVPGGAYQFVSPGEGEIVTRKFRKAGYNAFVLTYTINPLGDAPLKDQPMKDLSRAIRYIRKHKEEFHIDENKIVVCGFSAGGHLVGSIAVHHKDVKDENKMYEDISNRPNAVILSYPVITAYKGCHLGSFENLLGKDCLEEERKYYSLETQVNEDVPPCFIWQTLTDELVNVNNSYLFADALKEHNIPYAHHVFSCGKHGQSTADDDFKNCNFGEPYCVTQTNLVMKAVLEDKIDVPPFVKEIAKAYENFQIPKNEKNDEVASWVDLALVFLKNYL